jgi:hypothetical protein
MSTQKIMRVGWYIEITNELKAYDDSRWTCSRTSCSRHGDRHDHLKPNYCYYCGSLMKKCNFLQDHSKSFMDFKTHMNTDVAMPEGCFAVDLELEAPPELQEDGRIILVESYNNPYEIRYTLEHNCNPRTTADITYNRTTTCGPFKNKHAFVIAALDKFFEDGNVRLRHGVFFTYE